jgi:chromosome segregation protein
LRRLGEEKRRLEAASSRDHEEPQLREAAAKAKETLEAAEAALREATILLAEARAERGRLESEKSEIEARIAKLEAQAGELEAELAQREAESGQDAKLTSLNASLAELSAAVQTVETELQAAEADEEEARAQEAAARALAASAKLASQELDTELATLIKLLAPAHDWSPIVEEIKVTSGYEQALGAALGDDLDAASDETAPSHWRLTAASGEDPKLPEGAIPLSKFVKGPAVLSRRLKQIGLVDAGKGRELQAQLKPGQRLVSKDGDLWRWDGYSIQAGTASAAGARLMERRRLEALKKEAAEAQAGAAEAEAELKAATHRAEASQLKTKALRQEAKEAHAELDRVRDQIAAAEHEAQASSKALGALAEALARTRAAFDEAKAHASQVAAAMLEVSALASLEAGLEAAQLRAASSRQTAARADAALEGFEREVRLRQERLEAISAEEELWQKRIANAREQIATLRAREEETSADLAALENLPAEIEQRRSKLLDAIAAAERERSKAADDLALAETALKGREKALREVQERLAEAREGRARGEARLESARERRSEAAKAIRDQLDCAPEACLELARLKPGADIPPLADVEARLLKLKSDRERLGGVNLRAEEEEAELAAQLEEMEREKADVEEAISRLRQGIANLNREGRKRLLEAFDTVNGHFGRLFKTLFGGGSAELRLVDSDDPLESGLEIFACPPGKRPQSLTLLSGGEKALTALALIFAVFLTNPSPICVLDEVDAPLDDANVERFCLLMEEMAKETDTRFLIITHHPLTMSRMNRLFGVTMAERGVSQLVSVDLETAERLRDAS